jgi:2-iminoacetate synthase
MLLYAPLYLSSYCSNSCVYCGFNKSHRIARKRLTLSEALKEAEAVAELGFKDILLVSGEDKDSISINYLKDLSAELKNIFSSISVEIYPLDLAGYRELLSSGIDGVTLYQETYDRDLYAKFHISGPKASYENRLACQESAAEAGMRRLGIGSLLGLSNWRFECMAMALHADYLIKNYWKSKVSFSFPRLNISDSEKSNLNRVSDRDLTQMITALRICFPDAGLTLSTREPSALRDNLINLGITQMSAESKTVPGGYAQKSDSEAQFNVSDQRCAGDIAAELDRKGFEPVWKDWDNSFNSYTSPED